MKYVSFLGALSIFFSSYAPVQAQSWLDWKDYSDYIFPEKSVYAFPKNIENFKTANIQIWMNNQWRDSSRFTNAFSVNGLIQSSKKEVYAQGAWTDDGTGFFTFNNTGGLTQIQVGIGTAPAFIPLFRTNNTLGTGNRLEKSLTEQFDLITSAWGKESLDSNVYNIAGRQTNTYSWGINSNNVWGIVQRDSLKYNGAAQLDTTLTDFPDGGFPNYWDERWARTYNAAGKMTQLRNDVPKVNVAGALLLPFSWDSVINATKISYTYNAQNQLTQVLFEGTAVANTSNANISKSRYTFTVDAAGKVQQELNEEFNSVTQTWANVSKTIYTYYQVGTEEVLSANLLAVAPNPVQNGQLHIALQEAGYAIESVELYDLYGRNMLAQKVDKQTVIDLNLMGINNGQYLLKVKTDKGWLHKKLLLLN
jgi:hypothetical protein